MESCFKNRLGHVMYSIPNKILLGFIIILLLYKYDYYYTIYKDPVFMNSHHELILSILKEEYNLSDFEYSTVSKPDILESLNDGQDVWKSKDNTIIRYIFLFDGYTVVDISKNNLELLGLLNKNNFPQILKVIINEK